MVNVKLLVVFILTNMIVFVKSQTGCPCHDPTSGARWDRIVPRGSGPCQGTCDQAFRNESWVCITATNGTLVCPARTMPCSLPETCQGQWGTWSNAGKCNVTCGSGLRRQRRECRRINENSEIERFVRSEHCLGGNGNSTQIRFSVCRRRLCPTTLPMIENVSSTTHAVTTKETSTNVTNLATTINKNTSDNITEVETLVPPIEPRPVSVQVEPLTLAAVLGSVGLLCVVVVVVSVVMVKKRKKAQSRHSRILSTSVYLNRKPGDELNDYEFVVPNIINRSVNGNELLDPINRFSAANVLYNRNGEMTVRSNRELNLRSNTNISTRSNHNRNSGIYLEPYQSSTTRSLPIPQSTRTEEAIYMTIDDYDK